MKKIPGLPLLLFFTIRMFAQQEYDSLKRLLPLAVHDTTRLLILSELAEIGPELEWQVHNQQIKYIAARNILSHPQPRSVLHFYLESLSEAYFNEGTDQVGKMQLAKAQESFRKSIAVDKLIHNFRGLAYSQVELGKILTVQGNYELAIEALYQALKAYETIRDYKGAANTYVNIGRIYLRQNQGGKAFEFFSKGYKAYELVHYTKGMVDALDKMSSVYYEGGNMPEALIYMHRITDLFAEVPPADMGPHLLMYYRVSGKIHQLEGRPDSALYCYKKGLDLALEQDLTYELSGKHRFVASAYKDKKQYDRAIYHATEALRIARMTHSLDEEYKSARSLYELYARTGNHEKALRMHELSVLMGDSIRRQEDEARVVRQQFKYEFEKKELLAKVRNEQYISALTLEAERKNARKNFWLLAMAACLSLLAGAAFFVFKYLRQKNVIAGQKANLFRQKLLLSQMNPHFIFNSLNAIQSYIFRQDGMQASVYLSQLARLMRMILEFSRKDTISLASELEFLKLYLELQSLRLDHRFSYEILSDEPEPDLVSVPPMLAQPFIENAIEHGFTAHTVNGRVLVRISREGNFLRYTIEDNGKGLRKEEHDQGSQKSHESLAVKITTERLETLFTGQPERSRIEITDRLSAGETESGVRITFLIPTK